MEREVEKLVEDLCREHLTGEDYEVLYVNRHTKYLGRCRVFKRNMYTDAYKLYFSVPYFTYCYNNGKMSEIKDTILHEIAHALTHVKFGTNHKHDSYWQGVAESIGARPTRAVSTGYKPYKYMYECPHCHKTIKKMRRIKKDMACGQCCREYNNGKWSEQYVLKLIEVKDRAGV